MTERVTFWDCKLRLEGDLNFGEDDYKTQYISFTGCGNNHDNNWKNKQDIFERILSAISNSHLKESLQTININDWGFTAEEMKKILEKYGLNQLMIENHHNFNLLD